MNPRTFQLFPAPPPERKSAVLSFDGVYRYRLERVWDPDNPRRLVLVGHNPSTADGERDDPTIRRGRSFGKQLGCGGLVMVNVCAYRATFPRDLWFAKERGADIVGLGNLAAIALVAREYGTDARWIAAWGAGARIAPIAKALAEHLTRYHGVRMEALRINQDGSPQHPLYIPDHTTPVPWSPR